MKARGASSDTGAGAEAALRDRSIFINCPYDAEYQRAFDAIVFTVLCCGFVPRSALETDTTSDARMTRIMASLRESRYSIHDLTRYRGEGIDSLSRFNMPFELGIAMGMKEAGVVDRKSRPHDWTALVPEGVEFRSVISDLAGYDLKRYGTRETLVARVMAWVTTRRAEHEVPFTPAQVIAGLPRLDRTLAKLRKDWKGAETWLEVIRQSRACADGAGLGLPPV